MEIIKAVRLMTSDASIVSVAGIGRGVVSNAAESEPHL